MFSIISRRYAFWSVFCLIFCFTNPVHAKPEHGKTFKDWTVACEKLPTSGEEICNIFQNVTNDSGKVVMQFVVGYQPKSEQVQALITLPLGVMLPPGIELAAGTAKPFRVPYSVCVQNGCVAITKLDDEVIKGMQAGSKGSVKFAAARHQVVEVPVSLNGFTAAFKSLK